MKSEKNIDCKACEHCLFVNRSKNLESIAQPNQPAVNQVHTVEEKEEKTLEQESKRLD